MLPYLMKETSQMWLIKDLERGKRIFGYLNGSSEITGVLTRGRQKIRVNTSRYYNRGKRLEWGKEGATSYRMQETPRDYKRHAQRSLQKEWRSASTLISDFWLHTCKRINLCSKPLKFQLFVSVVIGNQHNLSREIDENYDFTYKNVCMHWFLF